MWNFIKGLFTAKQDIAIIDEPYKVEPPVVIITGDQVMTPVVEAAPPVVVKATAMKAKPKTRAKAPTKPKTPPKPKGK